MATVLVTMKRRLRQPFERYTVREWLSQQQQGGTNGHKLLYRLPTEEEWGMQHWLALANFWWGDDFDS